MVKPENPFTPGFGDTPSTLAGRDDVLGRIEEAMRRPRHPDRTLALIGGRGIGKTVVLNAAEAAARDRGWAVLSVTARRGGHLIDSLIQMALTPANWPEAWQAPVARAGYSARSLATPAAQSPDNMRYSQMGATLRSALTDLAELAASHNAGVLITVDELQGMNNEDAEDFAATVQHLIRRERRSLMFLGAGLPVVERTLFADEDLTFFQRCRRTTLKPLDGAEVEYAITASIEDAGSSIGEDAANAVVQEASGYPFMVQLIGFHAWEGSTDPGGGITAVDVGKGIQQAREEMGQLFIQPAWSGLSRGAQRYLQAMTLDQGESSTSIVAQRLGKSPTCAAHYRQELIDEGLAVSPGYGKVRFAHSSLPHWLRNNPALPPPPDVGTAPAAAGKPIARPEIQEALRTDPQTNAAALAAELGITASYVRQIRQAMYGKR